MIKVTGPSIKERIESIQGLKNEEDLNKNAVGGAGNADQAIQSAFDN